MVPSIVELTVLTWNFSIILFAKKIKLTTYKNEIVSSFLHELENRKHFIRREPTHLWNYNTIGVQNFEQSIWVSSLICCRSLDYNGNHFLHTEKNNIFLTTVLGSNLIVFCLTTLTIMKTLLMKSSKCIGLQAHPFFAFFTIRPENVVWSVKYNLRKTLLFDRILKSFCWEATLTHFV